MEIKEFLNSLQKMEKYYDKEYTDEQRKIMYERLKETSLKDFNRAINNVLESSKYLPKIADIKSALAIPNNQVNKKIEIEFTKCNKCKDGIIFYYKDIKDGNESIKYQYCALCDCENGRKQREINGIKFPFINEIIKN